MKGLCQLYGFVMNLFLLQGLQYTPKQTKYIKYLNEDNINLVISSGPAGTGKTWLACEYAIKKLKKNEVKKIIITRPLVTLEDEDIGFLPGNLQDKFGPFSQPVIEYFKNNYTLKDIDRQIQLGILETTPLGFLRGRTFTDTIIIADEMQNSSPKQILMLLTRLGSNSKLILTGDITQCDLDQNKTTENGLLKLNEKLDNYYTHYHEMLKDGIARVDFDLDDCQRSIFVKKIIQICDF